MKTSDQIQREIDDILLINNDEKDKRKRIGTKLTFLRSCKMYLHNNGSEDHLRRELKTSKNRIELANQMFYDNASTKEQKANAKDMKKENNRILKTVKYLLSE